MSCEADRLCAAAIRVRTGRQTGDPAAVEKQRLTADAAANRSRMATALVRLWQGLARVGPHYHPEDDWIATNGAEGATRGEMRDDIAKAIKSAEQIADRSPNDANAKVFAADLRRIQWHLHHSWPFA